jgi:dTDP-4-amino-4,6-dideoxygalactose transaminase
MVLAPRPESLSNHNFLPIAFSGGREVRARVQRRLESKGIGVRAYFDPPLHRAAPFLASWDGKTRANADRLASSVLALPVGASVGKKEIDYLCCEVLSELEKCLAGQMGGGPR